MITRISTKWVLAVLAAVVVPFAGFALFVNTKVSDRLSGDVVRQYLLSMAADLADQIDGDINQRRLDAETLATNTLLEWFVAGHEGDDNLFIDKVQPTFERLVELTGVYDLVLAVDRNGRFAVSNFFDSRGVPIDRDVLDSLMTADYSQDDWFQRAMAEGFAMIDHHRTPLLPPRYEDPHPGNYHVGFASRIEAPGESVGVVLLLMNWEHIQDQVSRYGVRHLDRNDPGSGVSEDIYKSSYAWIWMADANTIIAHPKRELYGSTITGPDVNLPELVQSARSAAWGMYPDYFFNDQRKKAAFKWCNGPAYGGFGWVVGVGVDYEDIQGSIRELSRLLFTGSALVLLLAVIWTVVIARRTTRPILDLERHTRRIAGGDLDTQIEVRSHDELGQLARSFNQMTTQLKENRVQLVKAEKDAAWREMARQVAHEIKNPLTPISLSAGLLKRAKEEGSGEFDQIFDRTMDLIQRQVGNMRDIVTDFYSFAGEHKEHTVVDVGSILDEVLELNAAWADQQKVRVTRQGGRARVVADPNELRRALLNLVNNAFEAMPEGGELTASVSTTKGEVLVEIRDTGEGLAEEVQDRLFDPYFTTRSSGTGLGLAIVRRIVEDLGGHVELGAAPGGRGAVARIFLPEPPSPQ